MADDKQVSEQLQQLDLVEQQINRLRILWREILAAYQKVAGQSLPHSEEMAARTLIAEAREIENTLQEFEGERLGLYLPGLDELQKARGDQSTLGRVDDNTRQLDAYIKVLRLARCRVAGPSIWTQLQEVEKVAERMLHGHPPDDYRDLWKTDREGMERLKQLAVEFEALLGTSIGTPTRWGDLNRHIHFGQSGDIRDIVNHDLPAIGSSLQALVGLHYLQPSPTSAAVVLPTVKGNVPNIVHATIDWSRINADRFEELCQKVLEDLPNWTEVRRPTDTNAPDKGKDLYAKIVLAEDLSGTQDERNVLVQCKHTNVGQRDIYDPVTLQAWHGKLHYVLIITSGRLSEGVEGLIRIWNEAWGLPQVRYVTGDELAKFLKQERPDLVQEYRLAADGDDGDGSESDG